MKYLQITTLSSFIVISLLIVSVRTQNDGNDLKLTEKEKIALEKFKPLVWNLLEESFMKSDFYLLRWLRQADIDVDKAQQILTETIAWRKRNNISTLLSEDYSDLREEYPLTYDGHDKQGRPLLFFHLGEWDLRAAIFHGIEKRLQRYLTYSTEEGLQKVLEAQQKGNQVTRLVVVIDGDGLNLHQHGCSFCLTMLMKWGTEKDNYYPDFTYETILLNVSGVGNFVLNAVKAVMSAKMRDELKTFPVGSTRWMTYLDQRIDKDQISTRFGGTKTLKNNVTTVTTDA